MTTKTKSEHAFDLLARLVKFTEPGGVFAFCTEAKSAEDIAMRDNFLAEVEGLLMSRGTDAGAVPPETALRVAQMAFREVRHVLYTANTKAVPLLMQIMEHGKPDANTSKEKTLALIQSFSAAMEAFSGAVANAGSLCDEYMHTLGVPPDLARQKPSKEEVDAMGDDGWWCNCQNCCNRRAKAALDKLKEGGAKSQ